MTIIDGVADSLTHAKGKKFILHFIATKNEFVFACNVMPKTFQRQNNAIFGYQTLNRIISQLNKCFSMMLKEEELSVIVRKPYAD